MTRRVGDHRARRGHTARARRPLELGRGRRRAAAASAGSRASTRATSPCGSPPRCTGSIPSALVPPKEARRMDRNVLLAIAAAQEAWQDAGARGGRRRAGRDPGRLRDRRHRDDRRAAPRVPRARARSRLARSSSRRCSSTPRAVRSRSSSACKGPNFAPVSACATGSTAVGEAAATIRRGQADVILAGGTESAIIPLILAGFCSMRGLVAEDEDPTRGSRPFDATRAGFVMGEGACILVLEELEHARSRGATIYAEVLGYGASNDAHHLAQPEPEATGVATMIRTALDVAGVAPERVGYVNAHGTSTPQGDLAETRAIKQVFGEHVYRLAVSSTKSVTGHCFGAAGAVEAMISRPRAPRGRATADDQLSHAGPGLRPRLRAERGTPRPGRRRALERDGPRRPQRLRARSVARRSVRRRDWRARLCS